MRLSSLREPGTQALTALRLCRLPVWWGQAPQTVTHADSRCREVSEAGIRDRVTTSRHAPSHGAVLVKALEPCRTRPQPVPWVPGSRAGPGMGELKGPREKARLRLLPHSPDDHHSTDSWLNGPLKVAP